MGNLFRLNSLFELEISQFPKIAIPNKLLLERSIALEYLFAIVSNPGDYVIMSEKPSDELLEHWSENKIQFGNIIITDTIYFAEEFYLTQKFPGKMNLVEWGKTSILSEEQKSIKKKENLILNSKFLNSKINQKNWKDSKNFTTLKGTICRDILEIESALSKLTLPIILKSDFGFSGRGNLIIKSKSDLKNLSAQINDILEKNTEGIIIEEWVRDQKIDDFSGLFDISSNESKLLAITQMIVDRNGAYKGSIIKKNYGRELASEMETLIKEYISSISFYEGPISLDGFSYLSENQTKIQYMSEINFRYSMGRILLEIHKKIGMENEEYALCFLPIRNKSIDFKTIIQGLSIIQSNYKVKILVITPLNSSSLKKNQFLGFYISSEDFFPIEVVNSIGKLLL
jgi:hypothetical protein